MEIGVVIGRFQVDSLHDGHRYLINKVFENHRRVIIFIGCSPIQGTKHDPLDFQTRLRMVQSEYPDAIVLPLHDQQHDQAWSDKLDATIRGTIPNVTSAMIYGGRDSFHGHYKGGFTPVMVESEVGYRSGTQQREDIGKVVRNSADFRAGVIYSTQGSWDHTIACVDIAVVRFWGTPVQVDILLGRKPNETKWRLPGGKVNRGSTFEQSAVRELEEETGLKASQAELEYLLSAPVGDWRMKKAGEIGLITVLYGVVYVDGTPRADDDLEEVKWFSLINAEREVMNGHRPLVLAAKRRYG